MNTKKMVLIALYTAMALGIYALESILSPLIPLVGVKLGLSNVVVLVAIYTLGKREAFLVLMLRIALSFLLFGNAMSALFSLGGGLLCFGAMSVVSAFLDKTQIWAVSITGAIFHSLGQIIVAYFVTGQKEIFYYLAVMILSSVITGLFTGLCATYSIKNFIKNTL